MQKALVELDRWPIQAGVPGEARLAGVEARCWLEWGSSLRCLRETVTLKPRPNPTFHAEPFAFIMKRRECRKIVTEAP